MFDVIDRSLSIAVLSLLAFLALSREPDVVIVEQRVDETCCSCVFDEPMRITATASFGTFEAHGATTPAVMPFRKLW